MKQSWEDIDVELIKTSFKCCGISLAGDDQESNWLFNTDQLYNGQDIEITNLNDVETNSEDNVLYIVRMSVSTTMIGGLMNKI